MSHTPHTTAADARVAEWIRFACEANDCADLADRITWTWSGRLTATAGRATYRNKHIEVSSVLWPRANAASHRNTVIHEACHIIAFHKYGSGDGAGHGRAWKACMVAANEDPRRCYTEDEINLDGIRQTRAPVPAFCGCGAISQLGSTRGGRARKAQRMGGVAYLCSKCRGPIRVH